MASPEVRRVYLAMSRRSASLPACVSFNLVPRSSSRPHAFRRWTAISRSKSSPSATYFKVSLSDGLRSGSDDSEGSVNANFQVRLGAFEQPLVLTHDNYLRPRLNVLTGRRFRPRGTPPDQCLRRAEACPRDQARVG